MSELSSVRRKQHKVFNLLRIPHADTLACDTIEDRKIKLLVVCVQVHEKLVDFVHDLIYPGILLVDLVDHKDRVQALLERLA